MIPLHFLSLEHLKLQRRYGKEKGIKIGKILGAFSGWMQLVFLLGFWISPQPRFMIFQGVFFSISFANFSIPILHLIIALSLLLVGAWIAIRGVRTISQVTGMKVVDTHCKPDEIVTSGPYSVIRHPQYLGAILSHVGGSILFSASYALVFTPIYVLCNFLISWKEEKELVGEFGKEYEDYRKKVPMFIPRF